MNEIRCGQCRRKLAEGVFTRLAIKCPRCGAFNQLSAQSAMNEHQGVPTTGIHEQPHHSLDRRQAPPCRPASKALSTS
ncbi:Com family DNA-binding transcriptional regulator [Comamonas terrigena]|uniref:Com family DNA-binding transcriptional regulator n=1 Tax=Comamonas terrigena TaxID=32013 RepID=UPI00244D6F96|nr:Com family DNA-binding transcriptional regulator [Comamonas terrigena]MDH0050289.1 Com family DNA-binding transcriptional regulator [Comamonas terrigena]MDH0512662.1 Com family DNA-binding transcriptional regulator [Comamonas terrigena]MDH1092897.1 Com family DNA-binding transcriptional regulator [Comamonas terrigena]MDH1502715.1 Com family DNA-binding transcriptional regulator [Comamonas terrigena]